MLAVVLKWIVVFVVTLVYDIFATLYLKKVQQGKALAGAIYSSLIYLLSAFVIIEYTADVTLIIPSILGGFIGTYFTIKLNNEKR